MKNLVAGLAAWLLLVFVANALGTLATVVLGLAVGIWLLIAIINFYERRPQK